MSNTINTASTLNALENATQGVQARASAPAATQATRVMFSDYMRTDKVGNMVDNVLGDPKKKNQFIASVISLYGEEKSLKDATNQSIVKACLKAAVLDLPIDNNLGFAWVIAYDRKIDGKKVKIAECQFGYKAYVQFALRTGKYKKINAIPVYEGELIAYDDLTEEIALDKSKRVSDTVIGYVGYFRLLDGFEKTVYWTKDQVEKHRQAHNKAEDKKSMNKAWSKHYDAMALKTVIKSMLSRWGLLSVHLEKALKVDNEENERIDITDDAIELEEAI